MNESCEEMQALMSGHLDGELGPEEKRALRAHVEGCAVCREEFDSLKVLVSATSELGVEAPPEEVWDTFLDNVYNRIERRTGWWILFVGLAGLTCFGAYLFWAQPWASALTKVLVATVFTGLLILFISVLRQRLFVAKTDRYSRDVKR